MVRVRFLSPEKFGTEPVEFDSQDQFFNYLLQRWGYSAKNFLDGATKIESGLYRYVTYAFGMIVMDTDMFNPWEGNSGTKRRNISGNRTPPSTSRNYK